MKIQLQIDVEIDKSNPTYLTAKTEFEVCNKRKDLHPVFLCFNANNKHLSRYPKRISFCIPKLFLSMNHEVNSTKNLFGNIQALCTDLELLCMPQEIKQYSDVE